MCIHYTHIHIYNLPWKTYITQLSKYAELWANDVTHLHNSDKHGQGLNFILALSKNYSNTNTNNNIFTVIV